MSQTRKPLIREMQKCTHHSKVFHLIPRKLSDHPRRSSSGKDIQPEKTDLQVLLVRSNSPGAAMGKSGRLARTSDRQCQNKCCTAEIVSPRYHLLVDRQAKLRHRVDGLPEKKALHNHRHHPLPAFACDNRRHSQSICSSSQGYHHSCLTPFRDPIQQDCTQAVSFWSTKLGQQRHKGMPLSTTVGLRFGSAVPATSLASRYN